MKLLFDLPLLALFVCILLVYYGAFFLFFRKTLQSTLHSTFNVVPEGLSPSALRYIWLGEADFNTLIASFLSAVHKGVYAIIWQVHGFSIKLKNAGALNELSPGEKAALTFSNGYPVKGLGVGVKKNTQLDKRMDALEIQLGKSYGHLLSPRKKWTLGGVLITAISFLAYDHFYHGSGWEFVLIKMATMLVVFGGYIFYLNKVMDEANWLIRIGDTLVFFLGISIVLSFDALMDYPVAIWFTMSLFVHTLIYLYLPKYSPKGQILKDQIDQYRAYLETAVDPEDESMQAYLFALDLPTYRSEQLGPLLTIRPAKKHRPGDTLLYW